MKVAFGVVAAVSLILLEGTSPFTQVNNVMNFLRQFWWMLPISSTISSLLVLGTAALAKRIVGHRLASWLSTRAYLLSSPSLAVLGFVSMLLPGASPPTWTASVILTVLLCSAWMYYRTTEESEKETKQKSSEKPFVFLGA